ncbi:unnamed protein product, partial [marine sediment metagenome]
MQEQRLAYAPYWDILTDVNIERTIQDAKAMNLNTLVVAAYAQGMATYT